MQPTMSVRDAARLLRVTPRTVRNWIASGRLQATRISERVTLIPLSEIERLTGNPARPDLSSVIWDIDLATLDEERNADFISDASLKPAARSRCRGCFGRYGEPRIEMVAEKGRGLPHPVARAWSELLRRRRERVA